MKSKCIVFGAVLYWDGDIVAQLKRITEISVPKDYIIDNGFTME